MVLRRQKKARIKNDGESKTGRQHEICTDLFKQANIQYFNIIYNTTVYRK